MKIYKQEKRIFEEKEYVEKEDTGWIELLRGLKYRRNNGIVTIRFYPEYASIPITQPWQRIATVPAGFRPSEAIFLNGYTNGVPPQVIGIMVSEIGGIYLLSPMISTTSVIANVMYQV